MCLVVALGERRECQEAKRDLKYLGTRRPPVCLGHVGVGVQGKGVMSTGAMHVLGGLVNSNKEYWGYLGFLE